MKSINERLRAIVLLLLQSRPYDSQSPTLREQISKLNDFGLEPKEISRILDRSNTYIYKELFELRKRKKTNKNHEKSKG